MHRRTTRTNRVMLALVGLVLAAAGALLIVRHYRLATTQLPGGTALYTRGQQHWVHHNSWVWLIVAAVVVILGLIALRWLLIQPRLDRLGGLRLDTDPDRRGRTIVDAEVLTDAVEDDVERYPEVDGVRALLIDAADDPVLVLRVRARPVTDLGSLYRRLVDEALPAARTALDLPHARAQVHLHVGGRGAARRVVD